MAYILYTRPVCLSGSRASRMRFWPLARTTRIGFVPGAAAELVRSGQWPENAHSNNRSLASLATNPIRRIRKPPLTPTDTQACNIWVHGHGTRECRNAIYAHLYRRLGVGVPGQTINSGYQRNHICDQRLNASIYCEACQGLLGWEGDFRARCSKPGRRGCKVAAV